MSSQENGIPDNIGDNLPGVLGIVSSTNTTPIQVTTTAHGLTTGDAVDISGHQTNTAANGEWDGVTVISPTVFSLDGSVGNGVGGATGAVQSLGLGPTFAVPSDGDPRNAASVDVALEALADRTAYLGAKLGGYRLVNVASAQLDDSGAGAVWASCVIAGTGAWTAFTGSPPPFSNLITNADASDLLEFQLDTTLNCDPILSGSLALYVSTVQPGASASFGRLGGSTKSWGFGATLAGSVPIIPVTLRSIIVPPIAGPYVSVTPYAYGISGTGTIHLIAGYTLTVKQWRKTGKPQ